MKILSVPNCSKEDVLKLITIIESSKLLLYLGFIPSRFISILYFESSFHFSIGEILIARGEAQLILDGISSESS